MGRRPPSPAVPVAGLDRPISRRSFLGRSLALGGALIVAGPLAGCGGASPARRPGRRRVVIVGAGLAGLTCAHRLCRRGVAVTVYEARADRVGGRCWTARGFAEGQVGEHGGEFIDSDHARIRALAGELGLRLEDRFAWERRRSGARSLIYLDGSLRRRRQVLRGFEALKRRLRADAVRTGYLTGAYESAAARRFDALSARDWLERNVPGGSDSLLGQVVSDVPHGGVRARSRQALRHEPLLHAREARPRPGLERRLGRALPRARRKRPDPPAAGRRAAGRDPAHGRAAAGPLAAGRRLLRDALRRRRPRRRRRAGRAGDPLHDPATGRSGAMQGSAP